MKYIWKFAVKHKCICSFVCMWKWLFFTCALQNNPFQTFAFTYVQMGLS